VLPYFILGVALLAGLLLMLRWYVSADPKTVLKLLKWGSLTVIVAIGLFLAITGRLNWAIFTLPVLIGWFMRFRALATRARNFARMAGAASGGGWGGGDGSGADSSGVQTRFLRMTLDHASGDMDGEVLEGEFHGRMLRTMSVAQLLALLDACRSADGHSAQILEAFLDRYHEGWREHDQGESVGGNRGGPGTGPMSRAEALEILGLEEGAHPEEIKQAHHRLMSGLHPDHGGSTYLASKINQAKDVLLKS